MSSTISWHIEKHASGDVGGLQIHNQRLTDHHSNKRIDISKSHENLHAKSIRTKFGEMSYTERIDREIKNRYLGKRKIRSNAIVDVEHTIQFGGDVFEKLSRVQKNNLMMSASQFVAEKFGGWENIIDWNAHLDETNDHAHMDMMPLTKDGRLSAKELYSKGALQIVQNELLTHMQELYPEMDFKRADEADRGFANGKTQKDYERLKALSDANKENLEQIKNLKNEIVEALRTIEPEFKVKDSTYDRAFNLSRKKAGMSKDVFYAAYGYQPEPIKNWQGFNQVKDFLSLKHLKKIFIDSWQRLKNKLEEKYTNKDKAISERESALEAQINQEQEETWQIFHHQIGGLDGFAEYDSYYADLVDEWRAGQSDEVDMQESALSEEEREPLIKRSEMAFIKENKFLTKKTMLHMIANKHEKGINTQLADIAIALGVHESWRNSMISMGAQYGQTTDGRTINKPFAELLPELLENATSKQLKAAQTLSQQWQQNYDEPHHGPSL